MNSALRQLAPALAACIQACEEVHDVCEYAVRDVLKKSTIYANVQHIGILLDCAEICLACARKCYALGETGIVEVCHRCAALCRNPHGLIIEPSEIARVTV